MSSRVALVTGGAHRVGREISVALARAGYAVAIHCNSSVREAAALVAELRSVGHAARQFQSDLADASSPAPLIASVTEQFGQLDLLVNSAAVMMRTPMGAVTVAQWDDMFALNLRAPFFLSQAAAPHLAATHGSIVNIADLAALETWPAYVPHGISKSGVIQMTRALANALAPDVRVNAVAPGAVLLPERWGDESRDHLVRTTPLRRLGRPADVAQAVLYLAAAEYVTGTTLVVDGGRHVRG